MLSTSKKKEGIILVDKPQGMTSHDVVDVVRRRLNIRKVGHAGTLDPLAEGLLIILVGRYTKFFPRFSSYDKEYMGVLKLGEVTTTGDSEGQTTRTASFSGVRPEQIQEVFAGFQGEQEQVPPMVSALRQKGKRLYRLARKGVVVERKPRKITVHSLTISSIDLPLVTFGLRCSKGTYVRKLAEDIGERLGCGAHIRKIVRLGIGAFGLAESVKIDAIDESHLRQVSW